VAAFNMPQRAAGPAQVKPWIPQSSPADEDVEPPSARAPVTVHTAGDLDATILGVAQRSDLPSSRWAAGLRTCTAAIQQGGTVVAGLPMPEGMATTMAHFQKAVDNYWIAYRQRRQVRNLYLLLLLMLTSLALFASSWLALHLSKQVTKPVEALADAMEAIAAGNYARRVAESATEELGELVRSFTIWPPTWKAAARRSRLPMPSSPSQRRVGSTPRRTGDDARDHPQWRCHAGHQALCGAGQPRSL